MPRLLGLRLSLTQQVTVLQNTLTYCCDVDESDFDSQVVTRSHEVPVLIDIGADWCAPCNVLTPMLEKLALEYAGKFILAKVDADENMRIAGHHKVRGFPTVIAYSRGLETDRFHSAQQDSFLRNFINRLIEHHQAGA
jgi:putative thioredoxin